MYGYLDAPSVSTFRPEVCFWRFFWGSNFRPSEDSGWFRYISGQGSQVHAESGLTCTHGACMTRFVCTRGSWILWQAHYFETLNYGIWSSLPRHSGGEPPRGRAGKLQVTEASASCVSRLITTPKRVHHLFHGVRDGSCEDFSVSLHKSYPERRSHHYSTCQPQPCTSVVSAACCGWGRVRRRLHRLRIDFRNSPLLFLYLKCAVIEVWSDCSSWHFAGTYLTFTSCQNSSCRFFLVFMINLHSLCVHLVGTMIPSICD